MEINGTIQRDSKNVPWLIINVSEGVTNFSLWFANSENVDEILGNFIRGMKSAAAELKREASGLIVAEGAIPNGLSSVRPAQGRK